MPGIKNSSLLLVIVLFFCGPLSAQEIAVNFRLMYGSSDLLLTDSSFSTQENDHLKISSLRFYVSKIQFLQDHKLVLEEKNSFHLVDAAIKRSQQILISTKKKIAVDEIRFQLGIDSLTNVSGALGGALDPTQGMYWAWQSGYINFKLEGSSDYCNTRKNEFQFHLGGYQSGYNALQVITLPIYSSDAIVIELDLKKIREQIDLKQLHHVMSPCKESVLVSQLISKAFVSRQP
jgi:hypothetical protein